VGITACSSLDAHRATVSRESFLDAWAFSLLL